MPSAPRKQRGLRRRKPPTERNVSQDPRTNNVRKRIGIRDRVRRARRHDPRGTGDCSHAKKITGSKRSSHRNCLLPEFAGEQSDDKLCAHVKRRFGRPHRIRLGHRNRTRFRWLGPCGGCRPLPRHADLQDWPKPQRLGLCCMGRGEVRPSNRRPGDSGKLAPTSPDPCTAGTAAATTTWGPAADWEAGEAEGNIARRTSRRNSPLSSRRPRIGRTGHEPNNLGFCRGSSGWKSSIARPWRSGETLPPVPKCPPGLGKSYLNLGTVREKWPRRRQFASVIQRNRRRLPAVPVYRQYLAQPLRLGPLNGKSERVVSQCPAIQQKPAAALLPSCLPSNREPTWAFGSRVRRRRPNSQGWRPAETLASFPCASRHLAREETWGVTKNRATWPSMIRNRRGRRPGTGDRLSTQPSLSTSGPTSEADCRPASSGGGRRFP